MKHGNNEYALCLFFPMSPYLDSFLNMLQQYGISILQKNILKFFQSCIGCMYI